MATVIRYGKRFWIAAYASFIMAMTTNLPQMLHSWGTHWVQNHQRILLLTSVNTVLTTSTEYISRSIWNKSVHKDKRYAFVTSNKGPWYKNINRQSLINIWMTFFASLIGAPVYFFSSRKSRFIFFISFGTGLSMFSQGVIGVLKEGVFAFALSRLYFDIFYTGTIKYGMFELFRRPLIGRAGWLKIFALRGKQDLLTTFFKTFLLNLFRFKG